MNSHEKIIKDVSIDSADKQRNECVNLKRPSAMYKSRTIQSLYNFAVIDTSPFFHDKKHKIETNPVLNIA